MSTNARTGPPVLVVGAGPGDPGLLTLRGQRALAEAQVVVFDADVPTAILEHVSEEAERVRVGEDAAAVPRAAVPPLLAARAASGLRVVRLVAGEASAFGDEGAALAAANVPLEVVPGVSRALAAAAYAGIPPIHASLGPRLAVLEAAETAALDWPRLAGAADTLLVPVTEDALATVVERLIRGGRHPETPAALIGEPTTFRQRTVTAPLRGLVAAARHEGVGLPAVLVVGEVVRLRPRLAWLERRPLFGRRVVVTRPRAQAARFAGLLEGYGAEVVALPTIRLEPPDDWRPLDDALARLGEFDWVAFTSANGVAAFRERLAQAGLDARALARARLAAIGPETAQALQAAGLRADVVPPEFRAEGLVDALRPHVGQGTEILLVRAAEARAVLPRELERLGARMTIAPAYRTGTVKEGADHVLGLLERRSVDVVTFTSSSTVRGFMALGRADELRRLLGGVALAAIGPITAATLAEYALEVAVMPREYTIPALAAAVAAHFARSA